MKLKYIFAVRKGGAIAHPDSYREVEQCSDGYRNENPCVPVPIAIRNDSWWHYNQKEILKQKGFSGQNFQFKVLLTQI